MQALVRGFIVRRTIYPKELKDYLIAQSALDLIISNVAEEVHVDPAEKLRQFVGRGSGKSDNGADQSRKHQTEAAEEQRVDDAVYEEPPIGIIRGNR